MKIMKTMLAAVLILSLCTPFFASAKDVPFQDVTKSDWFYNEVMDCYNRKVLNGVGYNEFAPNAPMTRAMFVQALANQAETYEIVDDQRFADVVSQDWCYGAVNWAADMGIVTGDSGYFLPDEPITRSEMAVMLFRYALKCSDDLIFGDEKGDSIASLFVDDEDIPAYARSAFEWAVKNKIVGGMGNHTLSPNTGLTRAQAAAVLYRAKDFNDPSNVTYLYEVTYNGKAIASMELPEAWKDTCYIDDVNVPISAMSKAFYCKADKTDSTNTGVLMHLEILKEGTSVPASGYIDCGAFRMDGTNFSLCLVPKFSPPLLQASDDAQAVNRYLTMREQVEQIAKTVRIYGIEESLTLNGAPVFTLIIPDEWKDKYIIRHFADENGNSQMALYERLNYESKDPSDQQGWIYTVSLQPSEDRVYDQQFFVAKILVDGKAWNVVVQPVSDIRYDTADQEKREAYLEILYNKASLINNGFLAKNVIVFSRDIVDLIW